MELRAYEGCMNICFKHGNLGDDCRACLKEAILARVEELKKTLETLNRFKFEP